MKNVTLQQIESTFEHILHDKKEIAKIRKEPFAGIPDNEVLGEIKRRLGDSWVLTENPTFKLKKEDIPALANGRFTRKSGTKLIMAWMIVVLALTMLTVTIKILPLYAYYGLGILFTAIFVFIYSKKQKKAREELKQEMRDAGMFID